MPTHDTLTPQEASYIATNAYFSLKDWINNAPVAGVESRANVQNRVLGPGNAGSAQSSVNTSLKSTGLSGANLGSVFSAVTGMGTRSGFGYLLHFTKGGTRHAVIATRGTRPELGAPDILTDLRAAMTGFGDYGLVHKGFKKTFDTVATSLQGADHKAVMDADVVHCVGHSLGAAVATLVAAHYASLGKQVKLYTFGSPRVGAGPTYAAMHQRIGKDNIFRVAHDLDPVTLIGPFPYIHVNPSPSDPNNFTIPSPTRQLFSTANHDMGEYIKSVGYDSQASWSDARGKAQMTDHDNAVLAKMLLHKDSNPGWVEYASAKTLTLLFKLFSHVLKKISTALILGLSALDLLAEALMTGLYKAAALAGEVYQLLCYAAKWAGIQLSAGADFTAQIIRSLLEAMMRQLQALAIKSVIFATRSLSTPLPLIVAGGWMISGGTPL